MSADPAPDDAPDPRGRDILVGQGAAVAALVEGERSGRLHHAWLIGGSPGIGKTTLAFRFARWLLAPPSERRPGGDGLGIDMCGRTARQIAAGSHPNLIVIERPPPEAEKAAKTIGVDAVRRALAFFGSTAADGGRRICVVDSLDDVTPAAANALLKTVEEPPRGGLILMVSHAPMRVLPTIRSRCRKLILPDLSRGEVEAVLLSLGGDFATAERDRLARAAALADGSVRRALALIEPKRLAILDEMRALLDALPEPPPRRVLALADKLGDRRQDDAFRLATDALFRWLADRVRAGQHLGAARLAPLAEVCENVAEAARAVETYNLDRRAFFITTFGDLAEAVRRAARDRPAQA